MAQNNDPTGVANIATRGKAANMYDAILIDSGISGGWAAK